MCVCASLTSIEIFDVFDDNIDMEFPSIGSLDYTSDRLTKKPTSTSTTACTGNSECPGKSIDTDDKHLKRNVSSIANITYNSYNISNIANNKTVDKNEGEHNKSINLTGDAWSETSNFQSAALQNLTISSVPFLCPEEELPTNIGTYEVPTQRDVLLHIRNHLLAMYHGFHTRAMNFLKDVKEATQASWARKMFCLGPTELMHYRRCVRWVGGLSVLTTKNLVTALETARHQINSLIQGKICNITALSVDPIHLIRILAAEKVSLEFALPDFLRQLDACARHCPSKRFLHQQDYLKTAHLTDKDFVIRHYLTQQNYNQQLDQKYNI